jgi:hypothetical protein
MLLFNNMGLYLLDKYKFHGDKIKIWSNKNTQSKRLPINDEEYIRTKYVHNNVIIYT